LFESRLLIFHKITMFFAQKKPFGWIIRIHQPANSCSQMPFGDDSRQSNHHSSDVSEFIVIHPGNMYGWYMGQLQPPIWDDSSWIIYSTVTEQGDRYHPDSHPIRIS
jgi:hypothetical protein